MSVYNGANYLREAVESILQQSLGEFEFIIIDDGSTDNTASVVELYASRESRIRIIRHPERRGLPRALNAGIRAARGEYVARQDADDRSLPDRLKRQVEFLERNPRVVVLGCRAHVIDSEGAPIESLSFPSDPRVIAKMLFERNVLCHGSVMIRRACLEQAGGYREFFSTSQDRDLFLRMTEHGEIANLEEYLYEYRDHSDAATKKDQGRRKALKRIIVAFAEQRAKLGVDDFGLHFGGSWYMRRDAISRCRQWSYRILVRSQANVYAANWTESIVCLTSALLLYPKNALAWALVSELAAKLAHKMTSQRSTRTRCRGS